MLLKLTSARTLQTKGKFFQSKIHCHFYSVFNCYQSYYVFYNCERSVFNDYLFSLQQPGGLLQTDPTPLRLPSLLQHWYWLWPARRIVYFMNFDIDFGSYFKTNFKRLNGKRNIEVVLQMFFTGRKIFGLGGSCSFRVLTPSKWDSIEFGFLGCVSGIWTSLSWLRWFGFRLEPIFTAPRMPQNITCIDQKWSKVTQNIYLT